MKDNPAEVESMDECQSDGNPDCPSAKDIHTLTDIYWVRIVLLPFRMDGVLIFL